MKISFEHVQKAYNEVERRLELDISYGALPTEYEYIERRNAMLQGVYSVLMMLSDNWPETRSFCDRVEQERKY